MPREVSQRELAEMVGLSTRQIRNLEIKGIPHRADGNRKLYPIPGAIEWYATWKYELGKEDGTPTEYQVALARKTSAEASIKELELSELRGELIRVDQHIDTLSTILERLRARLLAFPDIWAPQVAGLETPGEARAVLMPAMRQVLEELSADPESLVDDAYEAPEPSRLPDGFPSKPLLVAAGITSVEEVLVHEDLTSIEGIGKVRAQRIREYLEGWSDAA